MRGRRSSPTSRTACARSCRWRRRCCRRRDCSSSTSRSRASTRVASRQIKDLLQSFVPRGGTIFLTSHILEIVERLCDSHRRHRRRGGWSRRVRSRSCAAGGGGGTLEEMFIGLVGGTLRRGRRSTGSDVDDLVRYLRALVWLRWRMIMRSLARGRRRDLLERFSIALETIAPIVAVIMIVPAGLGLGLLGFVAGLLGRSAGGHDGRRDRPVHAALRLRVCGVLAARVSGERTGVGAAPAAPSPDPARRALRRSDARCPRRPLDRHRHPAVHRRPDRPCNGGPVCPPRSSRSAAACS